MNMRKLVLTYWLVIAKVWIIQNLISFCFKVHYNCVGLPLKGGHLTCNFWTQLSKTNFLMRTHEVVIQYKNIDEIEIINSQKSHEMHDVGIISIMHYHPIAKTWDFTRRESGRGSWRGEERKRIYLLKINGRDELNATDEPNPAPNENMGWRKFNPISSSWLDGLAAKLCHLRPTWNEASVRSGP